MYFFFIILTNIFPDANDYQYIFKSKVNIRNQFCILRKYFKIPDEQFLFLFVTTKNFTSILYNVWYWVVYMFMFFSINMCDNLSLSIFTPTPPPPPPPLWRSMLLYINVQYIHVLHTTRIHKKKVKKRNKILVYTKRNLSEKYIQLEKRKLYTRL